MKNILILKYLETTNQLEAILFGTQAISFLVLAEMDERDGQMIGLAIKKLCGAPVRCLAR